MSESTEQVIGPILPPNYGKNATDVDLDLPVDLSNNRENLADKTDVSSVESISDSKTSENTDSKIIGPVLPNDWKKNSSNSQMFDGYTYGPALPPGFQKQPTVQESNSDEEDDDDVVGPLPYEAVSSNSDCDVISDIERRAKKMRDHLEGKDREDATTPAREEWMIQLPETMGQKIGIVARTFRQQNLPKKNEDRSVWTDTPSDVERKSKETPEKNTTPDLHEYANQMRDQKMFEQMEEYNKNKRAESLLEMHRKNRKRKAKESSDPAERRPFDRELDLSVSRSNPKEMKTIVDKAKFLNSRFSHGSSHFL